MVIMRMFYLIRATINYSIFTDHYANAVSKDHGVKCNVRFALKCILKTQHIKIAFIAFIASNVVLGFALKIFERPFWAMKGRIEFEYMSTSIWLIFITMTTIGFGDYAPNTFAGRIVCTFAGLWGVFICSLVVVCLYGLLDLSNDQFLAFIKIVKSRVAVSFIENAYKFRLSRMKNRRNPDAIRDSYESMVDSFNEFSGMRNESKSIYRCNGLLYYNMKLFKEMKKVNSRFDKIQMDIEQLIGTEFNSYTFSTLNIINKVQIK